MLPVNSVHASAADVTSARWFGLAAVLISLSFVLTSWSFIKRSAHNLAEWGKTEAGSSAQAEPPVLTAVAISDQPLVHLLCLAGCFILSLW